jgi:hypothetical protein
MSEQHSYTVAIYNKQVRAALEKGETHKELDNSWADLHYIEVIARNETHVKSRMTSRYPARRGYVIAEVRMEKEFD